MKENAKQKVTCHDRVPQQLSLPWPGFEPGLSRPQREVLTTIRSRPSRHFDFWPWKWFQTFDVGYLCANLSLPRPLCSRPMPDVRERQIDRRQTDRQTLVVRQHHRLMPSRARHNNTTDRKASGVERNHPIDEWVLEGQNLWEWTLMQSCSHEIWHDNRSRGVECMPGLWWDCSAEGMHSSAYFSSQ